MTQSIRVSRGNAHTYLDDEDYELAQDFHWHKTQNGYVAGTVLEQGVRKRVYLHRWLLDAQPGQIVDHIDGTPLNNRRARRLLADGVFNGFRGVKSVILVGGGAKMVEPHALRHTFATRYQETNPDDLRGLAALLGHASLNTVMIYTELALDDWASRMEHVDSATD